MKKKYIAIVAVLALVVIAGGIVAGRTIAQSLAAPSPDQVEPTATVPSPSPTTPSAAPSFPVPTPLPTGSAALATGVEQKTDSAPTVTEDEAGNVTIVPNWEAKAQYAHPVERAPEANMGGSGGGEMDMTDGVYLGDHPDEETPAPTPRPTVPPTSAPSPTAAPSETPAPTTPPSVGDQAPAESTPANPAPEPTVAPTPAPPTGGSSLPPDDGTRYNGELSPDGKYGWFVGFGWVERGEGSYSTPSKGTNTELSGEKVGEM